MPRMTSTELVEFIKKSCLDEERFIAGFEEFLKTM